MARSIHVRLDEATAAALHLIRGDEMTDSEAVRAALRDAADRKRSRSAIREEVEQLAANEADRAAMDFIREQMSDLAPPAG